MTTDANLKAALEASLGMSRADLYELAHVKFDCSPAAKPIKVVELDPGNWPKPSLFRYVTMPAGGRGYESDYFEGSRPGVTSVLKVLGLGTNGLIRWAANEERKAVLEAVEKAYTSIGAHNDGVEGFMASVDTELGPARAHQKLLSKAGDLGSTVHQAVQAWLQAQINGQPEPNTKGMPDQALWAFMAVQDWWRESGLKAVRCEQPVWTGDYAGTIDIVAEHPRLGLGVVDLKTGNGLYTDHHLQVAAYVEAGRNFADIQWAKLVRPSKDVAKVSLEVRAVGDLYDGRTLTQGQLFEAFSYCLKIWRMLVS